MERSKEFEELNDKISEIAKLLYEVIKLKDVLEGDSFSEKEKKSLYIKSWQLLLQIRNIELKNDKPTD